MSPAHSSVNTYTTPTSTTSTSTTTATSSTSSSSQTITIPVPNIPVLHLHGTSQQVEDTEEQNGDNTKDKKKVSWKSEVIDNEFLNKKKSKICCIFHPTNEDEYEIEKKDNDNDGDSSSSSSSSSDSESDDEIGNTIPNAYERQPKYRRKHKLLPNGDDQENHHHHGCNH